MVLQGGHAPGAFPGGTVSALEALLNGLKTPEIGRLRGLRRMSFKSNKNRAACDSD